MLEVAEAETRKDQAHMGQKCVKVHRKNRKKNQRKVKTINDGKGLINADELLIVPNTKKIRFVNRRNENACDTDEERKKRE
jgi:hypothetical protein